jgi:hypothetical protein
MRARAPARGPEPQCPGRVVPGAGSICKSGAVGTPCIHDKGAETRFAASRDGTQVAKLSDAQGRYAEAEHLYLQSLEIRIHRLGSASWEVAQSLVSLATFSVDQGKDEEAEQRYVRAVDI